MRSPSGEHKQVLAREKSRNVGKLFFLLQTVGLHTVLRHHAWNCSGVPSAMALTLCGHAPWWQQASDPGDVLSSTASPIISYCIWHLDPCTDVLRRASPLVEMFTHAHILSFKARLLRYHYLLSVATWSAGFIFWTSALQDRGCICFHQPWDPCGSIQAFEKYF